MKLSILPAALFLLTSCTFVGKDDWGSLDRDGDGFMSMNYPEGDDCDDENPAVHPGAIEVCNGVDDDCEGTTDEDATDAGTWSTDSDGDGFGDDSSTVSACEGPEGTVALGGDCDDEEPSVYPDAPEICDHLDNDCDSLTDDDDSGVSGTTTWYRDSDGDEYGDPTDNVIRCEQPLDYIENGTDCDDELNSVHPGAEEIVDDGVDQDCDDGDTCFQDSDLDGYGSRTVVDSLDLDCLDEGESRTSDDCDDASEDDFPGATEYCDGVDNNCDSASDEDAAVDAEVWYRDADADGYGTVFDTHTACSAPKGYVGNDDDCDDSNSGVHPGAAESVADGEDQNCDGGESCFQDSDGDGFGDVVTISSLDLDCTDSGEASVSSDCDDGLSNAHPGAGEYCDGTDNDCDGTVDEDDALDAPVWYRDVDGDGYGDPAYTATACVAPSGYVEEGRDCDDALVEVNPAEEEVCGDRIDNNCDGSGSPCGLEGSIDLGSADAKLVGEEPDDEVGVSVSAGDVTGDGVDDAIIGASRAFLEAGAAYVIQGPVSGELDLQWADSQVTGETRNDRAGWSVSGADLSNDGINDLIVGALCYVGETAEEVGSIYVVFGPVTSSSLSSANARFEGEYHAGWSLAIGEFTGDALQDMIVGDPYVGDTDAGVVYLVQGPVSGTSNLSTTTTQVTGEASNDLAGYALATGDLNSDGVTDAVVGACGYDDGSTIEGAAYLVLGPLSGAIGLETADGLMTAEADDSAGMALAAGDVNSDGYDDILVGAPYRDEGRACAGVTYLVLGPATGIQSLSLAHAKIVGENAGDAAGSSISSGDVDDDSYYDLIVGSFNHNSNTGAIYLVSGPVSGSVSLGSADAVLEGETAGDLAGASITTGDFDDDGFDDILAGAPLNDAGGTNSGAAYLILGGGL